MPIRDPVKLKAARKRYYYKRKADPVRNAKHLKYQRQYALKHPYITKYNAYHHGDKVKQRDNDLDRSWAYALMMEPCHYCKHSPGGGLDRLDNEKGHWSWNTVSCCEHCNFLLGDLPPGACDIMATALREIRTHGYFDSWVIPTKRHLPKS